MSSLTLATQPVKLFLAEMGLLFMAKFDDKMDGIETNNVNFLNFSAYLSILVNCSDIALDSVNYFLFVECNDRINDFFNIKVNLTRDNNSII
jgi:hypothetical protein